MEHSVAAYADEVMRAGQLAAALEVSAWPKPGNVHRFSDYPHKHFEHFIAGSIAMGPALREAAVLGGSLGLFQIREDEVKVGRLIKKAVLDVKSWHRGGNTHLGIALLFIPLAVAAGFTYARYGTLTPEKLRNSAAEVMKNTTSLDAVEVYEAIIIANPSGLSEVSSTKAPDIKDPSYRDSIINEGLTLLDVMKEAERWDNVAWELSRGFEATFTIALPEFLKVYGEAKDINLATVQTYLKLLASKPDTFIARNVGASLNLKLPEAVEVGMVKAEEVMRRAQEVLKLGGALSEEGRRELKRMDRELKKAGGILNPGSTADLTATCLFVAILCGIRP